MLTLRDVEGRGVLASVVVALVGPLGTADVVVELKADGFWRCQLAKSVERHRHSAIAHQLCRELLIRAVPSRSVHQLGDKERVFDRLVFDSCQSKLIGQKPVEPLDRSVRLRVVDRSSGMFDAERFEEVFNLERHELLSIVGDFCRQTQSREHFLEEADHGALSDGVNGTHFWPLEMKVVRDDEVAPA